ncbi:MAG: VOC family protein [Actinobacteria bacterium]|nr:VOC family protein [Actinomycetota bacterium]
MPNAAVIPVPGDADVTEVADWLCDAFGFRVRLRIGDHRVQLVFADGAVVVAGGGAADGGADSVMVRVEDADAHHERAVAAGARIVSPPTDYPYGERQYTAEDPGGRRWTFSQSIADSDPADWGGVLVRAG